MDLFIVHYGINSSLPVVARLSMPDMRPSGFNKRIDTTDLQLQRTVPDPVEKLLRTSAEQLQGVGTLHGTSSGRVTVRIAGAGSPLFANDRAFNQPRNWFWI